MSARPLGAPERAADGQFSPLSLFVVCRGRAGTPALGLTHTTLTHTHTMQESFLSWNEVRAKREHVREKATGGTTPPCRLTSLAFLSLFFFQPPLITRRPPPPFTTQLWWVLLLALGISILVAICTLLRRCVAHHRTPAPPAFGAPGGGGGGPSSGGAGPPPYDRTASELAAVATVERYALHPGGRPQTEERAGLDERLLARLQSFSFKKPARKAAAAVEAAAGPGTGDVEAPPAAAASTTTPPKAAGKGATEGEEEEEDRPCVICTDPLSEGRVVALPCGHLFHKPCALPWLVQEATCPECRFEITPEMLGGTSRRGRRGRW